MKRCRQRAVLGSLLPGWLLLACAAVLAQSATLKPLQPAEIASVTAQLSPGLLPAHSSEMKVEAKQAFRLSAAGQPDLLLVPVKFWHGEPSEIDADHSLVNEDRCGLFVVPATGAQQFVWTITDKLDLAVGLCHGLSALGTMLNEGPRPRLIAIYNTYSPPRAEDTVVQVLAWDAASGAYKVDAKVFASLNGGQVTQTIPGVRAALAQGKR